MKNLVLICGGVSPEHDISIRSVKNILSALDRDKYQVQVIGISKTGQWFLLDETTIGTSVPDTGEEVNIRPGSKACFVTSKGSVGDVDVVFPMMHGPNGEDGSMQGLLQLLGLPFVGPGVLGSSISMDKDVAKKILTQQGVGVAKWRLIRIKEEIPSYEAISKELGAVVFVKPANMGSSVGVSRVSSKEEWQEAVTEARKYDRKVIVEELLNGRELECAVLGNESPIASGVGEVRSGEVYSYDEKYAESSSAETIIPAEVSENELQKLRSVAVEAYKALECQGLSRVDMFLSTNGDIYVNEVNTMPGFTSISMYPKLWAQEGTNYSDLLDRLIELAIERG